MDFYGREEVLHSDKSLIDLYTEALTDLRYKNSLNSLNVSRETSIDKKSQEVLHGYLYLKYDKLYLKWLFVDRGDDIEYYRCHKFLRYTGELNGFKFSNGIVSHERKPEKIYHALKKMFAENDEEIIVKKYGLSVENFARLFSQKLKFHKFGIEKHFSYQSNLFKDGIGRKNRHVFKNDKFLDTESAEYVYNDHIIICDEYYIIYQLLTELANYKFFKTHSQCSSYCFSKHFADEEMIQFIQDIKLSFDIQTLRLIIKSSISDKPLSEELKNNFLLMMHIIERNLKNKQTNFS